MNNRLEDYIEYLYVTNQLETIIIEDLIRKYNSIYGELDEDFFDFSLDEQKDLLEKSLKYKVKIIKK